ncbi:MAG TPA: aldehyde dehydrogenase family protein, partial [Candidatus Cybelea sp.]
GKFVERRGFFYEPTVVSDVEPGMAMFEEEVFGPAAAVIRASGRERAISLANDSRFGLGANIWSRDVALAEQLAARMEAGSVFINGMVTSDPRLPFGGIKKSGYGRELSAFGIHEFVNVQTVWIGP